MQGKQLCRSLFLIQLQDFYLYLKRDYGIGVFPRILRNTSFTKYLRTTTFGFKSNHKSNNFNEVNFNLEKLVL